MPRPKAYIEQADVDIDLRLDLHRRQIGAGAGEIGNGGRIAGIGFVLTATHALPGRDPLDSHRSHQVNVFVRTPSNARTEEAGTRLMGLKALELPPDPSPEFLMDAPFCERAAGETPPPPHPWIKSTMAPFLWLGPRGKRLRGFAPACSRATIDRWIACRLRINAIADAVVALSSGLARPDGRHRSRSRHDHQVCHRRRAAGRRGRLACIVPRAHQVMAQSSDRR